MIPPSFCDNAPFRLLYMHMTEQQKKELAAKARSYIGVPYAYGSDPKDAGTSFDCSSFTAHLFSHIGITLPRSSILQAADAQGKEIIPADDYTNLETGDLLFMRGVRGFYRDSLFGGRELSIGHVVVYMGEGTAIHAQAHREPHGVCTEPLSSLTADPHYRIVLVKRF